ncbi:MAG: LysR substrate-binding domain-containing protein [Lautropia sp.]
MDRIDHLRIFTRVAACRSFVQAADQLRLPRASVTTAIQLLETRLGTRLLNRTTRRVGLTQDGEALLERAQGLLADLDELEHAFRPAAGALTGRIRVDLPSRIARCVVAPALPAFLDRHPGLAIEIGSTDRVIDLIREGVDCALRVGTLAPSSLVARLIGMMVLINCASPAYLSRCGTPRVPADLLPDADPAPMPVHVVYPHRRHLSRRLQAFIGWLESVMAPYLSAPQFPAVEPVRR